MTVALKILLINPPYLTLTSLLGTGHQIPLGLLWLGELIWELLGIRCARHATKAMAAQPEPKKNRKDLEQIKESNGKPATRRSKVKRVNYPSFLPDGLSRKKRSGSASKNRIISSDISLAGSALVEPNQYTATAKCVKDSMLIV
ncbi:MAG: hypothetical protein ABIL06_18160 [Pseudomonadota bacterium]